MTTDEPRTLRLEKLLTALSDEEVDRFCFHHFSDVYQQFGRGLSRGEKILRGGEEQPPPHPRDLDSRMTRKDPP